VELGNWGKRREIVDRKKQDLLSEKNNDIPLVKKSAYVPILYVGSHIVFRSNLFSSSLRSWLCTCIVILGSGSFTVLVTDCKEIFGCFFFFFLSQDTVSVSVSMRVCTSFFPFSGHILFFIPSSVI
jgi:hypothetical protein